MPSLPLSSRDSGGLRLPFRRRRGRIERWRDAIAERGLPIDLPPAGTVGAALRALPERIDLADAPALVRERLSLARGSTRVEPKGSRLEPRVGRAPASSGGRRGLEEAGAPVRQRPVLPRWVIIASLAAGAALGLGVGMLLTRRRAASRQRVQRMTDAADEIKAAWPDVTDDDIQRARGRADRLAETIRSRTGEDADRVRERLAEFTKGEE